MQINTTTTAAIRSTTGPVRVRWEGEWYVHHSLAKVNRELVARLSRSADLRLSLVAGAAARVEAGADFGVSSDAIARLPVTGACSTTPVAEAALADRRVDVHVSHRWPPRFERPDASRWVWIQPWEFGALPATWLEPLRTGVDEVWAPSRYVRQLYLDAGVDPAIVHRVPNGVDTAAFRPGVAPLRLPTRARFRFLFVGGTIWRKGIDVLLQAYASAFSSAADVALVIKDMGTTSFYRHAHARESIERLQRTPGVAEILYLEETLGEADMPRLYAACDCLVHPYRGEGFGLPVAEAMACGLPVVVTAGGACDDFCDTDCAALVGARRIELPPADFETVGAPWALEPDVEDLARHMRELHADATMRARLGRQAAARIRGEFGWDRAAEIARRRLHALAGGP